MTNSTETLHTVEEPTDHTLYVECNMSTTWGEFFSSGTISVEAVDEEGSVLCPFCWETITEAVEIDEPTPMDESEARLYSSNYEAWAAL